MKTLARLTSLATLTVALTTFRRKNAILDRDSSRQGTVRLNLGVELPHSWRAELSGHCHRQIRYSAWQGRFPSV